MPDNPPQRLIVQPSGSLTGERHLPGDKSLSHRAALFAALSSGACQVENFLDAGVTRVMLRALTSLGVTWSLDGNRLIVHGRGFNGLQPPGEPIDCGNSATTLRLLAGALAAANLPAVLDGSVALSRRPMSRIIQPLSQMGAVIRGSVEGFAPLVIERTSLPLQPLEIRLPVASAQVKSCLLLAALAATGASTLEEPGPSRDHTERMLRSLGVTIDSRVIETEQGVRYITRIEPPPGFQQGWAFPPFRFTLPGDFSSAAFLIVAALITPGSRVVLRDVGLNPTRTGLLDALLSMGADIQMQQTGVQGGEPLGNLIIRHSLLTGTDISGSLVVRMIDEFPALAVAAAFARGQTTVSQAQELRHKESDRITVLLSELQRLGINASETSDGFVLQGSGGKAKLPGGTASAQGDHRLAMALALVGLTSQNPVTVEGAELIAESFPNYVATLQSLGADICYE